MESVYTSETPDEETLLSFFPTFKDKLP